MSMGGNDRWLGGAEEVKRDRESDCLLSSTPGTYIHYQVSKAHIYDIALYDMADIKCLICVPLFILSIQVKNHANVIHTHPRSSAVASYSLVLKQSFTRSCIILCT